MIHSNYPYNIDNSFGSFCSSEENKNIPNNLIKEEKEKDLTIGVGSDTSKQQV